MVVASSDGKFRRGDLTGDGLGLPDAIGILVSIFVRETEPLDCPDAADFNDDGRLSLADVIGLLIHVFAHGRPPAEPTDCGVDPTADGIPCPVDVCFD